nr:MAG TPA: hypothetical protein [Inoviridae sp.]
MSIRCSQGRTLRMLCGRTVRLLALDGIAFRPVARPVSPMRYVRRRWAYLLIATLPPAAVLARGRR